MKKEELRGRKMSSEEGGEAKRKEERSYKEEGRKEATRKGEAKRKEGEAKRKEWELRGRTGS